MLLRTTHQSDGIVEYLESGKKLGRELDRDELDKRVYIAGDLASLSRAIEYTKHHKPQWKHHYWHITASFSLENNDLDIATLREITREILAYYYCQHALNDLIYAAEAHFPRYQAQVDKSTGETRQRLLHIHLAVSKLNMATGDQVRMLLFKASAERALQSYLCEQYGFVDPVTRQRDKPMSMKNIISRWRAEHQVTAKQTQVTELRKLFSELLRDVNDLEDAKERVLETGIAKKVLLKAYANSGNQYLQVQTTLDTRNINLRGRGFERLEALYSPRDGHPSRAARAQLERVPSSKEHRAIFQSHQQWWCKEEDKRLKSVTRRRDWGPLERKLQSRFGGGHQPSGVIIRRKTDRPLNAVQQLRADDSAAVFATAHHHKIDALNRSLDASLVIDYASKKYGLLKEHFAVTHSNKVMEKRVNRQPISLSDLLVKTCHVPIQEAFPALQKLQEQQLSMNLSICTQKSLNGLNGWQVVQAKTFTELEHLLKTYPYAAFTNLSQDHRKASNVVGLGNVAIFDIDNDPDTPNLSLLQAQSLLSGITHLRITSRNHQAVKTKPGGNTLPAVDRYRIVVPLTQPLSTNKDEYRVAIVALSEQLGLVSYADPKAMKDIARQYYPSPVDAQVFVNNTTKAVNTTHLCEQARATLKRMETEKSEAKARVLHMASAERVKARDQADYPLTLHLDAMNQLPLPEIYEDITQHTLVEEGSYLMGYGVTSGTSRSRRSLTLFRSHGDAGDWLWHDFKSGESGNVVSFLKHAAGMNAFQAAQYLSERFSVNLLSENLLYYQKIVHKALETATNDKSFEYEIKRATGAQFVKLAQSSIRISTLELSLESLGLSKLGVINRFRENRAAQVSWDHDNSGDGISFS